MKNGYDNFSTYFQISLNSSEIPTIFIHGVGLDNSMWKPQKIYFKNKSTIYYDLLNHGKTKKSYNALNFKNFNNQLIQLIYFLKIKKFNLVGFSLGSLIAQHFASVFYKKINKLIIISSIYKRTKLQREKVLERYKMHLKGKNINEETIKRWFNSDYLKFNPNVYNFFNNILKRKREINFLPAYKLFIESDNYKLNFSNFQMPTLIITGEDEVGSTPKMSKNLNKKIKDSKVYIIPKAKHLAIYEKSDIVNLEISNFIENKNI